MQQIGETKPDSGAARLCEYWGGNLFKKSDRKYLIIIGPFFFQSSSLARGRLNKQLSASLE